MYQQRNDQLIPDTIELPTFPTLPNDVVTQLQGIVEVGNEDVGDAVADMLAKIQVQSARIECIIRWRNHSEGAMVTAKNIERYVVDVAEIYCIAAGMFEFARRKSESISTVGTKDGLASALNQIGFWSEDFPSIHDLAQKT